METETQTPFNMSIATLQRIDNILTDLYTYNKINNMTLILRTLQSLYRESNSYFSKPDKELAKKKWEALILISDSDRGRKSIAASDFDFWIREKLMKKGLLMSNSDDRGL